VPQKKKGKEKEEREKETGFQVCEDWRENLL
jgi:hypothetical protein